jgi:coenzyme PQQ biosynthesis protein PqqD
LRDKDACSVVLIPEGLIRLNDSALQLICLCDGQRKVLMIVADLRAQREDPAGRMEADMENFILCLVERKVLVLL